MRQSIPLELIKAVWNIEIELQRLFDKGKLNGKKESLLKAECETRGFSYSTYTHLRSKIKRIMMRSNRITIA